MIHGFLGDFGILIGYDSMKQWHVWLYLAMIFGTPAMFGILIGHDPQVSTVLGHS